MRQSESNVTIVAATSFDMSDQTEIQMKFEAPSGGTDFTVGSGDGVSLSAGATYPSPVGTVVANTALKWPSDGTSFDVTGTWKCRAIYTDSATSPTTYYIGDSFDIVIEADDA